MLVYPYFHKVEAQLGMEMEEILLQEEKYWRKKSRINWLKVDKRNTRFFHMSTVTQRRHNRITCLKNPLGNWVLEDSILREMARNFYSSLYTKEPTSQVKFSAGVFYG